MSERTGYAPWSLTREAGVQSATVDGTIKGPQNIQPVLDTGFVDEKGDWKGVKSSDETFTIDAPHLAVPNSADVLSPQRANADFIDMSGFTDLQFAVKVTNTGNYAFKAVMGPDTNSFANLTPVNAAERLQGAGAGVRGPADRLDDLFVDGADDMSANVWHVYTIFNVLANQKNMQFLITNSSGDASDIDFAYLRLV